MGSTTFLKPPRKLELKEKRKNPYATWIIDNNSTVRKIQTDYKSQEQTTKAEQVQPASSSHKQNETIPSIYKYPCNLYSMNIHKMTDNNLDFIEKPIDSMYHISIGLGLERVYRFMDKLKSQVSPSDGNDDNEINSLGREGMSESPVLI